MNNVLHSAIKIGDKKIPKITPWLHPDYLCEINNDEMIIFYKPRINIKKDLDIHSQLKYNDISNIKILVSKRIGPSTIVPSTYYYIAFKIEKVSGGNITIETLAWDLAIELLDYLKLKNVKIIDGIGIESLLKQTPTSEIYDYFEERFEQLPKEFIISLLN